MTGQSKEAKKSNDDSPPAPQSSPEEVFFPKKKIPPMIYPSKSSAHLRDHFEPHMLGYLRTPPTSPVGPSEVPVT